MNSDFIKAIFGKLRSFLVVKPMFETFAMQVNELAMIVGYSTIVLGVLYLGASVAKGLYNRGQAEAKKEKKS